MEKSKQYNAGEQLVAINGENIAYTDSLYGDTTLLFIHGSFINKEYWRQQINFFAPQYRVVAFDLAGHGHSSHNRDLYTIDEYGNDLLELIQTLNLSKVILVGHSIGAGIMLMAANDSSVTGMVAVDYFKNAGVQLPEEQINAVMTGLRNKFSDTNEQYARQALLTEGTDASIRSRVIADFRNITKTVGISMNEDFFHFPPTEKKLLSGLDKKLVLINVDYQPTDEKILKELLGDKYQLQTIPGTCHFPMIEHPVEFNRHLGTAIDVILHPAAK